jgi:hypothetical protein
VIPDVPHLHLSAQRRNGEKTSILDVVSHVEAADAKVMAIERSRKFEA